MTKDVYELVEFLRSSASLISESERQGMFEYVDVDRLLSEIMIRVDATRGVDEYPDDSGIVAADEDMDAEVFYDDEYVHDDEDS